MKARAQTLTLAGKEIIAETVREDLFAEQPARRLFRSNKRDLLIQEFIAPQGTDGDSNGSVREQGGRIPLLRNQTSSYLFEYLRGFHVSTHYVGAREGAEMLVKLAEPLPLLVKIYNAAEERWVERFGPGASGRMELPVIEHYLVVSGGPPVWVNEYHLSAFNLLKPDEFRQVNRLASKVNAVLRGLSDRRDLFLAGVQLTYGRYNNQVILTGELSSLTCRFQEAVKPGRTVNGAFKPVEAASESDVERLYNRLKLNG